MKAVEDFPLIITEAHLCKTRGEEDKHEWTTESKQDAPHPHADPVPSIATYLHWAYTWWHVPSTWCPTRWVALRWVPLVKARRRHSIWWRAPKLRWRAAKGWHTWWWALHHGGWWLHCIRHGTSPCKQKNKLSKQTNFDIALKLKLNWCFVWGTWCLISFSFGCVGRICLCYSCLSCCGSCSTTSRLNSSSLS